MQVYMYWYDWLSLWNHSYAWVLRINKIPAVVHTSIPLGF